MAQIFENPVVANAIGDTLIVEMGEGRRDANSYVTVADANAFHSRQNANWRGEMAQKEQALIAASTLLDQHFTWLGERRLSDQAMAWPRQNAQTAANTAVPEGIPPAIRRAVAMVALWWLEAHQADATRPQAGLRDSTETLQRIGTPFQRRQLHQILQRHMCRGMASQVGSR